MIDVGMNRTPREADRRRRVRVRRRARLADHARPRRRRPDDDRDAAAQHPRRGEGRRRCRCAGPSLWPASAASLLLVSLFLPWYGVEAPARIGVGVDRLDALAGARVIDVLLALLALLAIARPGRHARDARPGEADRDRRARQRDRLARASLLVAVPAARLPGPTTRRLRYGAWLALAGALLAGSAAG